MITNERQYKITRNKAKSFAQAIKEFDAAAQESLGIHPRLVRAELEAMESQLADLCDELKEYERLKSAELSVISVTSFDDLADGLIKARIAAGLSQRTLAQRLELKEQQIQRYEAERYASASYKRMCQIAHALGVRIENEILLPVVPASFEGLLAKVSQVGLSREFVVGRLLSTADAAVAEGEVPEEQNNEKLTAKTAATLERVFGWTRENILGAQALSATRAATEAARFKMPKGRRESTAGLFAAYANHLAIVAVQGMGDYPKKTIPGDAGEMRRRILAYRQGKDDLRSVLHTVWDLGVVVLPLKGEGTFHGACWRHEGRNAIILKQTSKHEARWTFDLLHELFHAAQRPEQDTFEVVEKAATSNERCESEEEVSASQYAGDVMLDSNAEVLAQECVSLAHGRVERLKRTVRRVAKKHNVSTGALANYLAFALSQQRINWWGAAANLQRKSDPWKIARDVFIERHPYRIGNEIDRTLLDRALN